MSKLSFNEFGKSVPNFSKIRKESEDPVLLLHHHLIKVNSAAVGVFSFHSKEHAIKC